MGKKVIIVTGAGSGIGRASAQKLAEDGWSVMCADYNEKTARETAEQIAASGGQAHYVKVDVTKPEAVQAMVDFTARQYGTLNGIFNNAGVGFIKPFLELDPESYHRVIDVNQHGVYYGMYYAARKMVELEAQGVIINTASVYAYSFAVGTFNYHAAKAAVVAMSKAGAVELRDHHIRVVGIAPGFVDTPILGDNDDYKQKIARQHLRGQLIRPEEIAEVVAFLASPSARAINGTVVTADDGFLSFK